MISLAPAAEQHYEELVSFYADRGRDSAIDTLSKCVERASRRFLAGKGRFFDAHRPYRTLLRPGWRWTKEGPYWIAFGHGRDGSVIRAIFHESADMPDRV